MTIIKNMKEQLKEEIKTAVQQAGLCAKADMPSIELEHPKEKAHGDYASNIAMKLAKVAKKKPALIAEDIQQQFDYDKVSVEKIDIAGPGFMNFFMDNRYLTALVPEIIKQGKRYGESREGGGKSVLVEFVSANPTGSLHLGHARGAAIGDTLCHVMTAAGYDVGREYYTNDAGNQIHMLTQSVETRYFQALGYDAEMPENGYHGQDIVRFGEELAETYGQRYVKATAEQRYDVFREYSLQRVIDGLKADLQAFGVSFDEWFSEQSLYETGAITNVINQLKASGYSYEKDGALWFRSSDFGDDKDRVIVKNDGHNTYLLPDIAYHLNKFERGYEYLIDLMGPDHHGYIPRMKAAIQALGYEEDQLNIHIYQNVNLFQNGERVSMSKRTGKAVTMRDLMDEVGVDATRYFFAMRSADTHLDFDMDLAVSQSNENPVYYVQYAHARICTMLQKGAELGYQESSLLEGSYLQTDKEIDLLKMLGALPEVVAQSAETLAVQRVTNYAYDLAAALHRFYNAEKVLDEAKPEQSAARYQLMRAVQITLKNTLTMIGVRAPESM